jgi:hypothetical protein
MNVAQEIKYLVAPMTAAETSGWLAGSRLRLESRSTVLILRVVVCGVGGACRFAYVLIADHAADSLCQIVAEDPRACCLISIRPW